MIPNSYRILKLKSGEQIIAEIKNSSSKKFIVKRPMSIRMGMQVDPLGGQKDFTILKNWLYHSDEIETSIPSDFVATILKPTQQISDMYDYEKELEDAPRPSKKDDLMGADSFVSKIEEMLAEELEKFKDEEDESRDTLDEERDMLILSMSLPYDALKKLVDVGIFTKKELKEMISGTSDTPKNLEEISGEEVWTPDGDGSNWTDFSPFAKDYVDGVTGDNEIDE